MHLVFAEVISAFSRRLCEGYITPTEYQTLRNVFRAGCIHHYALIATALSANQTLLSKGQSPLIFLCADNRLNTAATAEGLTVDNPNRHP